MESFSHSSKHPLLDMLAKLFCLLAAVGLLNVHIALYQGYAWVMELNDRIAEQGIKGTQANGLHTLNPVLSSLADPAGSGGTGEDTHMGVNYVS